MVIIRPVLKSGRRLVGLCLMFGGVTSALGQNAIEITLLAPGGIRAAIEQLIPGFEQKTGIHVKATFGSGLGTKQQIVRGEAFDVPVIQPPFPEVIASGHVIPESARTLASVSVGLAVRKGTAKPDISTADSLKRVLLEAKSISYPDPSGGAAAGVSFDQTIIRLGIADQLGPKLRRAQGGAGAMTMVATGEAEIGFTFLSEMDHAGIEICGALPAEVASPTTLVAFVSTGAKDAGAARQLVEWLTAPTAAAAYRAAGMEPAPGR